MAEAAQLLGVSDDTVRRWVEAGRLTSTTDNGRLAVDGAELAVLAESLADSPDVEGRRRSSPGSSSQSARTP
jgi:predicted site-specific integrase-resolvase